MGFYDTRSVHSTMCPPPKVKLLLSVRFLKTKGKQNIESSKINLYCWEKHFKLQQTSHQKQKRPEESGIPFLNVQRKELLTAKFVSNENIF